MSQQNGASRNPDLGNELRVASAEILCQISEVNSGKTYQEERQHNSKEIARRFSGEIRRPIAYENP